jgi:hypothetical protein
VHKVCMRKRADFSIVCRVRLLQTFKQKSAQSMRRVCTKSAWSARVLHKVCVRTTRLSGKSGLLVNYADLMHTFCRIAQTYCRNDADYAISVQFAHFSVVICQVCTTKILQTLCTLMQTAADIMQTLCSMVCSQLG